MDRKEYIKPEISVTFIKTEGVICASVTPEVTLKDWEEDTTVAPYDGDIWLPI